MVFPHVRNLCHPSLHHRHRFIPCLHPILPPIFRTAVS
jgi:hypothetical protein